MKIFTLLLLQLILCMPSREDENQKDGETVKYVLEWSESDITWTDDRCPFQNCFFTSNRSYFKDIRSFDALLFHSNHLSNYKSSELPQTRSVHQKYVFHSTESADDYPLCTNIYTRFFNWTSTYRLDSNIPNPHITINDRNGTIVGPRRDLVWQQDMQDVDDKDLSERLSYKTKAAAWFVAHCKSRSKRELYGRYLKKELNKRGLQLDIYGSCSFCNKKTCRKTCREMLERDYYFYLSFESSIDEDYVTDILLTALQSEIVPIVYGGANYSRFLPPFSYLDAGIYTPAQLAARMDYIIRSPKLYLLYFRWRFHYSYSGFYERNIQNMCPICTALNDETMMRKYASYVKIRKWWNKNYRRRCFGWTLDRARG